MMKNVTMPELGDFLHDELHCRVMPFWLAHAVDDQCGGLLTCLDEEGQILSTDKYVWSQARALWVFSTLAIREPQSRYREVADSLFEFCSRYGMDDQGRWVYTLSREGNVVQGADSIYADGFALLGLAAYFQLTGLPACEKMILDTYESVRTRLATPGSYDIFPYHLPEGAKAHGVCMLFSLVFREAGRVLGDQRMQEHGLSLALEILHHFVSQRHGAILEFLDLENRPLPGAIGRCCLPGHGFESMWTLIHIFKDRGQQDQVARCVEIVRWHLDKGWDEEFGGIFLAIDLAGEKPYWPYADYKPWWPAVEAMHLLLLSYHETKADWCLDWYRRIHNYAFTHYPVRPHGEWRNRLDRKGKPVQDVIALPVKDPFHLPRALILAGDVLAHLQNDSVTMELVTR